MNTNSSYYRNQTEQLIDMVDTVIQEQLKTNLQELHLSKSRIMVLTKQKKEFKEMLGRCGTGDIVAKEYIKDAISSIITGTLHLDEEKLEKVIPFRQDELMSGQDMFECLMYEYSQKYGKRALEYFLVEHQLDCRKNEVKDIYEITGEDIARIYTGKMHSLSFREKTAIVTQRVYQHYRGLGVVDIIRDMNVDGVSGGVSGTGEEEKSVWILFRGRSVYLSFLGFRTRKELQRVCRNLYRYGHPGQLSRTRGYIVNEMADHARVVVARPNFCENWVFFVRKLDNLESRSLNELITGKNSHFVICLLEGIVKGAQNLAVTGAQGSGKTTLLMALAGCIPGEYTIRVQERAFELQLRRLYPYRNIVAFRETDSVSSQEGLNLQKKTDGCVSIIGEVADCHTTSLMLQLGQTASLFTMFTHHANSTQTLIRSLRNDLLHSGEFSKEDIAEQQVVSVVRFHVHMCKSRSGERYIERISEILSLPVRNEKGDYFEERVLLSYREGSYEWRQPISMEAKECMEGNMTRKEREKYAVLFV